MTPLYVTSDWHLGAVRSAGTRPDTAYQLRQDLLQQFGNMLEEIVVDGDLALNGDLLDTACISMADLAQVMQHLVRWLERTGRQLYCINGNHDISRNSTNYSSFEFLAAMLSAQFPEQVHHITAGAWLRDGVYAVSHVANQALMDLELERVPPCDYLLLHCNFNNHFAQQADHSLDLSEAQAKALPAGCILMGHEHQQREELQGRLIIAGNPQPSSISDCLGNATKRLLKITDDGVEFIETWRAEGDYVELDWRALTDTGARFIRAVGTATAAEAAQVVSTLSQFRAKSSCLVLGNAVKVEGLNDAAQLELSHEQITAFNVLEALRPMLSEEENKKITTLLEKQHVA